jgi:hypothetical protein
MPTAFQTPRRLRHAAVIAAVIAGVSALASLALLASVAAGRPSHGRRQPRRASCTEIAFAPNSDDIAFDIRTVGATCSTGRSVAQASAPSGLRPGPDRAFRAAGFHCQGTFVQPVGKWYERYVCRSGRTRVVFDRG